MGVDQSIARFHRPGWPRETALLKNFVVQAKSLPIEVEQLDAIPAPAAKGEHRAACRLLPQHILRDSGQTLDALAHVRDTAGEINPHTCAWTDHATSARRIRRISTASGSTALALMMRPLLRTISMR